MSTDAKGPGVPFSIRLPREVRQALEEDAAKTDRSMSYVAAKALEEWAKRRKS